jgi:hypothetical protein
MSKDYLQEFNTIIFFEELIKLDQDVLVRGSKYVVNVEC